MAGNYGALQNVDPQSVVREGELQQIIDPQSVVREGELQQLQQMMQGAVSDKEADMLRNIVQAQFTTDDYNTPQTFLNALRQQGSMNMFDAVVPLQEAFNLDRDEAIRILADWMENFGS